MLSRQQGCSSLQQCTVTHSFDASTEDQFSSQLCTSSSAARHNSMEAQKSILLV